ncbi:hypothetical protein ACJA23_02240 [Mycoplasma corogypsi]|uniref:hypothetical protein n=1 Tax=Mycoplasma corogypsi TaxID=2106 RepID=UPI0038738898
MTKNHFGKMEEIAFWVIYLPVCLIFLIIGLLDQKLLGLFFGYASGGMLAYFFFKVNIIVSTLVFKASNKRLIYFFYLFKMFFIAIFVFALFYPAIKINQHFAPNKNQIDHIRTATINWITIIAGLSINFFVFALAEIFRLIQPKLKTKKYKYGKEA